MHWKLLPCSNDYKWGRTPHSLGGRRMYNLEKQVNWKKSAIKGFMIRERLITKHVSGSGMSRSPEKSSVLMELPCLVQTYIKGVVINRGSLCILTSSSAQSWPQPHPQMIHPKSFSRKSLARPPKPFHGSSLVGEKLRTHCKSPSPSHPRLLSIQDQFPSQVNKCNLRP